MKNYIAYYRVSTEKQGRSGLGLEAQKEIVKRYINDSGTTIAEYTDIESGKNNDRQKLTAAIQHANETGATLLIAKLDRLSRNAGFIFFLRDSAVNFICCDIPDMNTLTIGIFATMAQHERELISKRTKEALQAKKRAGATLGNPNGFTSDAQKKASATKAQKAANNTNTSKAIAILRDIIELARYRRQSLTISGVAKELNRYGIKTPSGKVFTPSNVRYLLNCAMNQLNIKSLPKYDQRKQIAMEVYKSDLSTSNKKSQDTGIAA